MGIHFDDTGYDCDYEDNGVEGGGMADVLPTGTPRLQYLEFIRDVTFGNNPNLEVVKCHKYPEFGKITRDEINGVIIRLANCGWCGGEGCNTCIPGLEKDMKQNPFHIEVLDPGELIGKTINVAFQKHRGTNYIAQVKSLEEGNMMDTMNPEFYDRQAAEMLRRAEVLRTIPRSDVFADSQVITFDRTFLSQGTAPAESTYHYAAIKSAGLWFATGDQGPNGVFWDQLMAFIGIANLGTLRVLDMEKSVPMADYTKGIQAALDKKAGDE